MAEENGDFIKRYKDIARSKRLNEKLAQYQEEEAQRDAISRADEAKRYEKKGTVSGEKGRVDKWDVVKQRAEQLMGANAASYNDFRQGMNEIWQACMVLADALAYSYEEFARATIGSLAQLGFYTLRDNIVKIKISMSDPDVAELQYKVSLDDGNKLQASFEKGEDLSNEELKALFEADIKQWLETKGYKENAEEKKYLDPNGVELTQKTLDKLMADTSTEGFEVWIKDRYKGLTINPALEDNAPPSPSP